MGTERMKKKKNSALFHLNGYKKANKKNTNDRSGHEIKKLKLKLIISSKPTMFSCFLQKNNLSSNNKYNQFCTCGLCCICFVTLVQSCWTTSSFMQIFKIKHILMFNCTSVLVVFAQTVHTPSFLCITFFISWIEQILLVNSCWDITTKISMVFIY